MARFSLMQMLAFVFACCVYLAATRGLYVNLGSLHYLVRSSRVIDADTANEISALWLPIATQTGAWLVLSGLYCVWRLWFAMVVHSAFAIYLAYGIVSAADISALPFERIVLLCLIACTPGTLVSFPTAILTLAIRGLTAKRQAN